MRSCHPIHSRRFIIVRFFLVLCLLLSTLSGCQNTNFSSGNKGFETFTGNLFQQEVSSNTINLHYTLKNPKEYGILDAPVTFGTFQSNEAMAKASLENCIAALSAYSYRSLSKDNKLTYDILESYLNTALEGADYILYEEPLSPLTGVQSQLPILLSEYQFHTAKDVDVYLELLATTPDYFASLVQFEKDKSANGLFMSSSLADHVISECTAFLEMGNSNYLFSTFAERLENVKDLTTAQKDGYISKNNEEISNSVFAAYQSLIYELGLLRDTGHNNYGLSYFPAGRGYYEHVVKRDTGSSKSISDLKKDTRNQIIEDLRAMEPLLTGSGTPAASDEFAADSSKPKQILEELKGKMKKQFPGAPKVTMQIKYVPEAMQQYVSPAFYMIPAIDNVKSNTIYINELRTVEGLELFTTLAHEGYPGHLYQTTYYASTKPDPIRSILNFGGYVEGWGTYAEMCSYYLAPISKKEATLSQKNASAILGLYALADIGIHYDGWTLEDAVTFFQTYGIADVNTIQSIYELILGDPGNYLKYYIGYLEILNLKKEAVRKWGDAYSSKAFHKAILDIGPAPFDIIRRYAIN